MYRYKLKKTSTCFRTDWEIIDCYNVFLKLPTKIHDKDLRHTIIKNHTPNKRTSNILFIYNVKQKLHNNELDKLYIQNLKDRCIFYEQRNT